MPHFNWCVIIFLSCCFNDCCCLLSDINCHYSYWTALIIMTNEINADFLKNLMFYLWNFVNSFSWDKKKENIVRFSCGGQRLIHMIIILNIAIIDLKINSGMIFFLFFSEQGRESMRVVTDRLGVVQNFPDHLHSLDQSIDQWLIPSEPAERISDSLNRCSIRRRAAAANSEEEREWHLAEELAHCTASRFRIEEDENSLQAQWEVFIFTSCTEFHGVHVVLVVSNSNTKWGQKVKLGQIFINNSNKNLIKINSMSIKII